MSSIRNPINDVGGAKVYGIDDPKLLEEDTSLSFVKEHEIVPRHFEVATYCKNTAD